MQYIEDIGCLTQRSQLDRLQEFADRITRERIRALQLADVDHEQSLTARIVHQPDSEPSLSPWDFGKVAWTVRLRHVLRAARGTAAEEAVPPTAHPATAPVRQSEPAVGRQSLRREMREQLHRAPAAAASWIQ